MDKYLHLLHPRLLLDDSLSVLSDRWMTRAVSFTYSPSISCFFHLSSFHLTPPPPSSFLHLHLQRNNHHHSICSSAQGKILIERLNSFCLELIGEYLTSLALQLPGLTQLNTTSTKATASKPQHLQHHLPPPSSSSKAPVSFHNGDSSHSYIPPEQLLNSHPTCHFKQASMSE